MNQFWRPDWLFDNPFLLLDLRRWSHKGYFWMLPLACGLLMALPIAVVLILQIWMRPPWIIRGHEVTGAAMAGAASLMHLLIFAIYSSRVTTLTTEAIQDRADFIHLIPRSRLDMLIQMGVARAALRFLPLIAPIPLYVLLLSYGALEWLDIGALTLLFATFLFAPPGAQEIWASRTTQPGQDPQQAAAEAKKKIGGGAQWGWAVWVGLQVFGNTLLRPVIFPLVRWIWQQGQMLVGGPLAALFPLTIVPAMARLLWAPQDFYRWTLTPVILLLPWWLIRVAGRTLYSAQLWGSEPVQIELAGGKKTFVQPRSQREDRIYSRPALLLAIAGFIFTTTLIGLFWQPFVVTGAFAGLIGSATPSGSLAAILAVVGLVVLVALMETIRGQVRHSDAFRDPVSEQALNGALTLGRLAVVVVLASIAGGASLWPEPAEMGVRLAAGFVAVVLFASAWRRIGRRFVGTLEESMELGPRPFRETAGAVLWVATYLVPLLCVVWRPDPELHLAAALSPVYGLLSLLPSIWRSGFMLHPLLAFGVSAGVSGLVVLPTLRRQARKRAVAGPKKREEVQARDELLEKLATWFDEHDYSYPHLRLALHRMARKGGIRANLIMSAAASVILFLILMLALQYLAISNGSSLGMLLGGDDGRSGVGGWIAIFALVIGWIIMFVLALTPSTVVKQEELIGRFQQRLSQLLMSGMTDRALLDGVLFTTALRMAASLVFLIVSGLLWTIFGLIYGMHPLLAGLWWLGLFCTPFWAGTMACCAFQGWHRPARLLDRIRQVLIMQWPVELVALLLAGTMVLTAVAAGHGYPLAPDWGILLPFIGAVIALIGPFGFGPCYRLALSGIRLARREEDLERTVTLGQQSAQTAAIAAANRLG